MKDCCDEYEVFSGKDTGDGIEWGYACKLSWTGETCPYTDDMCPLKEEYYEKRGWEIDE